MTHEQRSRRDFLGVTGAAITGAVPLPSLRTTLVSSEPTD
jgi:hypothetical protein